MENLEIKVEECNMLVEMSGRVDSSNSGSIQAIIDEAIEKASDVKKMIVDAANLEYISSAGLRVLLSCKKKINDFSIINVSRDVYDILEMTGFASILEVKKALRELSIDGLEMIGQGTCGKVYRMDDETIVKVFNEGFDMGKIESERENSQKSFINGIDTAISYDVVKVGNQVGVVYEMLNADTFRSAMKKDQDRIEYYIGIYAEFLKGMHNTHFQPGALMPVKPRWYGSIGYIPVFSDDEKEKVKQMLGAVEDRDTFVHGDYNIGNVMYQNDKAILIDMADASVGHPIFDLAGVYLGFVLFPQLIPDEYCEKMTGFTKADNVVMWNKFCEVYFGANTEEERAVYEKQLKPFAAFRVVQASLAVSAFPDEMIQYCKSIVLEANKDGIHTLEF